MRRCVGKYPKDFTMVMRCKKMRSSTPFEGSKGAARYMAELLAHLPL
jgi:hypothetical protein